ncbi:prephenate dehydrogenase/arogenate dehydrogenase family protein [Rhodococcus sp. G-MC3]|uniref:prephenate dehydrogenase dimerization domain-containing protein n=1 Tax=Rhodococcus sp. G-MC3 TaxID=3046209 RepID=UPI0024B8D820|nr:prephenate dehydrogenase dimerization domain-containing protein [Rhodococcus sp. G-MC3]MDJ0392775.1 prephenate dehydrogenase/arogenate dehydrogenase family protein [Rhodococcus sp. G-MC3]
MKIYDAVVVGGRGAVGTLLAGHLAEDGLTVLAVDRTPAPEGPSPYDHAVGNVDRPNEPLRRTMKAAPIVVLAVPESVALSLPAELVGPNSLVVETLSVKSNFAARVDESFGTGTVLGINPMFAPSLGMAGRPVAAVEHRGGVAADEFMDRLSRWGATVVHVDADQHDRLAAATQALTHASVLAFGVALSTLDVSAELVDAVSPPPARTTLALLARICGGEPEVYWDVQAGNPYAASARRALADAVRELDDTVATGSEPAFAALVQRAGAGVPDGDRYRTLCASIFGIVRETPGERGRA